MIGPVQLGILGLIVVLLFGTKKLPELGSGLGKAISNFKNSYREGSEIDVTPKVSHNEGSGSTGEGNREETTK
jgi:sec-independent protein translocase protein TatA